MSIIMRKVNHKSLIIQWFYETPYHSAVFCFGIWLYIDWQFSVVLFGHLAVIYSVKWHLISSAGGSNYSVTASVHPLNSYTFI